MVVNLFYLTPNTFGGWVTYTYHLYKALEDNGVTVNLYKIGNRTEKKSREFGYSLTYRNLSMEDALSLEGYNLILATSKKFIEKADQLLRAGSFITIHDPTEIKNIPDSLDSSRVIVIRKAGLKAFPEATFIPHPYKRNYKDNTYNPDRLSHCVSVCRIDFDKKTEILLEANETLEPANRIEIYGFENRLYTKFKIKPRFPNWEQSVSAYPREEGAASAILKDSIFHVDMSNIVGDGGGTQYTFLEAWDAGAINILNDTWIIQGDTMVPGENCLAVKDSEELVTILNETDISTLEDIAANGYECLKVHDHVSIGKQYINFFNDKGEL